MTIRKTGRGRPKHLTPYKSDNGVYVFSWPKKFDGQPMLTPPWGISVFTRNRRVASERIRALMTTFRMLRAHGRGEETC